MTSTPGSGGGGWTGGAAPLIAALLLAALVGSLITLRLVGSGSEVSGAEEPPTIPPENIPETPIFLLTTGVEGLPKRIRQGEKVSFTIKVYCFKPECEFRPTITLTLLRNLPPPEELTPESFSGPLEVNLSTESPVGGEVFELVAGEGDSRIRLAIWPFPAFTMREGEVRALNATLEVGPAVPPGRYRINIIVKGALSDGGTSIETCDIEVFPGRG